jgi:hypothetical protein
MAKTTEESNYWASNYIQHRARIAPGRDGLFNLNRSTPLVQKLDRRRCRPSGRRRARGTRRISRRGTRQRYETLVVTFRRNWQGGNQADVLEPDLRIRTSPENLRLSASGPRSRFAVLSRCPRWNAASSNLQVQSSPSLLTGPSPLQRLRPSDAVPPHTPARLSASFLTLPQASTKEHT